MRELGIGFVAYSPLGRGFLAGKFQRPEDIPPEDFRRHHPRFEGENFYKNIELVRHIETLAKQKNATTAQIALAWLMAQGQDIVPIFGAQKRSRIDENVQALAVTLSAAELQQIDRVFPKGSTAGLRYPAQHMHAVNI